MYDAAAGCWHERLALLCYSRAYEGLFGRLSADGTLRSLRDGGRALDCGMGTGAFGLALAGKVAAPLRNEGVAINPSMLQRASLNLDRVGIGARMHLPDVNDLPFEDGTFDAVVGAHVLEHLDDPFTRLAEMARVLKPHGPVVIVVTRRGLPDALLRLRWRHTRIDQARLMREAEEAGFSEVRPHPLLAGGPLPRRTSVAYAGFKRPQSYVARAGGRRTAETSKLSARGGTA